MDHADQYTIRTGTVMLLETLAIWKNSKSILTSTRRFYMMSMFVDLAKFFQKYKTNYFAAAKAGISDYVERYPSQDFDEEELKVVLAPNIKSIESFFMVNLCGLVNASEDNDGELTFLPDFLRSKLTSVNPNELIALIEERIELLSQEEQE